VTEVAALEAPAPPAPPAPTLEDAHTETSSPGEEPPLTVTAEPPTEPPAVEHQEPVDEPAPPVQAQVPADRRTALSAALAARRGR
jgi:hypothetical protein